MSLRWSTRLQARSGRTGREGFCHYLERQTLPAVAIRTVNSTLTGRSMRATVMYAAGDVRVENVPDPVLREPTDAIVRVTPSASAAATCGRTSRCRASEDGRRMGHEFIGVVEDVGSEVSSFKRGDLVVAPFVWADNTCDFCAEGLHDVLPPRRRVGSSGR